MDIFDIAMANALNKGGSGGGAVLPVVEIADSSAITAEESAKLTACIGMPCVIKYDGAAFLFSYAYDGLPLFIGGINNTMFVCPDGANWQMADS